jgi:radical SAM protein with 4Fe4S-binding SPASM domain
LSFTAHRDNYREFPEVARLARSLGVNRVWADRLVPLGQGEQLREQMLTPQQARELFEIMRCQRRTAWFRRTEIGMRRSLQFLVAGGRPYRCTAGRSLITLLPSGDLCPCRRMPSVVGNVRKTPLQDLYFDHPLLRSLRDPTRVPAGCERCFYSQTCGGGSRCIASAVHGDPWRADPGCWLARVDQPAAPATS